MPGHDYPANELRCFADWLSATAGLGIVRGHTYSTGRDVATGSFAPKFLDNCSKSIACAPIIKLASPPLVRDRLFGGPSQGFTQTRWRWRFRIWVNQSWIRIGGFCSPVHAHFGRRDLPVLWLALRIGRRSSLLLMTMPMPSPRDEVTPGRPFARGMRRPRRGTRSAPATSGPRQTGRQEKPKPLLLHQLQRSPELQGGVQEGHRTGSGRLRPGRTGRRV